MDKNIKNWKKIYSRGLAGGLLRYPNENLVALFTKYKSLINLEGCCLDYGFGSANNSEFLVQYMASLHGVEIASSCLDIARDRLAAYKKFDPSLFVVRQDLSGYENKFDLVVAWQVLCYNDMQGLKDRVRMLQASLKPGGILITTLTIQSDIKAKFASQVAPNTFVIDERIPHQEGCQIFAVKDKNEFLSIFEAFEVLDAGWFGRGSFCEERTLSEYYLVARKP